MLSPGKICSAERMTCRDFSLQRKQPDWMLSIQMRARLPLLHSKTCVSAFPTTIKTWARSVFVAHTCLMRPRFLIHQSLIEHDCLCLQIGSSTNDQSAACDKCGNPGPLRASGIGSSVHLQPIGAVWCLCLLYSYDRLICTPLQSLVRPL